MKGWHQMRNHQIVRKPVMYGRHQMKRGQMKGRNEMRNHQM